MLKELRIKNFTIIDRISLEFGQGFNVLTGETGAGKSIIVDAVAILLGEKASQDMIKTGEADASIEAVFDHADILVLKELGIPAQEDIIFRRTLSFQGKGRAYINDVSVNMQTMADAASALINIHGQHQHQDLLNKEYHLEFLDKYAGLSEISSQYRELYYEVSAIRTKAAALKSKADDRAQRVDFLKFQTQEISAANLQPGEKNELESERSILQNAVRLKESAEVAYSMLYEADNSIITQLSSVISKMREASQVDVEISDALATISSAEPLLQDAALFMRGIRSKYDADPARLDYVEERIEQIRRIEKKYGASIEAALAYYDKAMKELEELEHIDEETGSVETELAAKEAELLNRGRALSEKRKASCQKMQEDILEELRKVGFQKAVFELHFRETEPNSNGIDDVEFMFSANPGEAARPLIKVASGGELSRIMLALKCIEFASGKKTGTKTVNKTLIFDEVDSGIGGVTAQQVGARLKNIAAGYQALCITHLPQIAAMAGRHIKIDKSVESDSVKVRAEAVNGKERQAEIARMLSGNVTESSLKHAAELLSDTV
ncbi:MAG: DNA repair protein RecN [Dissulfurispiraceae bacterium]|jgi:DNA repair protein RecN (Recombination protein N)|nr:DNA repair protein RecN [Dissulfurispiraceae bacterium]